MTPPANIAHYRITAKLGEGGMGTVYRATDTKLNREVAVKMLPEAFSKDPDRLARFTREARLLASLNHPNIVAIYDVGPGYIVTELVDGKPLRHLKPTVREAAEWAAQVADGLAAAHAAGITHRDLKLDNVMVARDGRVKILDFGLAQQAGDQALGASEITRTLAGTVLGTVGYMSPEQVRAQAVDTRSDIFSFGATLYEMLSGTQPFAAETAVQSMSAILEKDPPPLPDVVPQGLKSIVTRCLEKEPARRFQSASDLAYALRALSSPWGPIPGERSSTQRFRVGPAVAALVAVLAVGAAIWALRPWQPDLANYRFVPFATEEYPEYGAVWSSDGRSIAYCAIVNNEYRVMVKSLDGGLPTAIAHHPLGNLSITNLSWSADSSRVYYAFRGQAFSVARTGGAPEPLRSGENVRVTGVAAAPDGSGVVFEHAGEAVSGQFEYHLWFLPSRGGTAARIPYADTRALQDLVWSPDSSQLLATRSGGGGDQLVVIGRNGAARNLTEGAFSRSVYAAWLPGNRYALVSTFPSEQGIRMVDTHTGKMRSVLPSATAVGSLSASPDGRRIACTMGVSRASIVEFPLDGSPPRPFLGSHASNSQLGWSPDGTEFAYVYEEEIRVRNRAGTAERTVVSHRDFPGYRGSLHFEKPSFSPDGQRLLYTIFGLQGRREGIWISPVSGGTPAVVEQAIGYAPVWTSNGSAILFNPPGAGIRRYRLGSSDPAEPIYPNGCDPTESPDGKWMLCPNTRDGMVLVSLETKQVRSLSSERMATAAFSKDGQSIYAVHGTPGAQQLVKLDVATGRVKTISTLPDAYVITGPYGGPTRMALSPDGKSVYTTILEMEGDIWILEGFNPPHSSWEW